MDIEADIGRVAIPALVVCGDDDKMTPPDLSRFIADAIPGAKLALIEGAGHYVMRERPEAFNQVLADLCVGCHEGKAADSQQLFPVRLSISAAGCRLQAVGCEVDQTDETNETNEINERNEEGEWTSKTSSSSARVA